MACSPNSFLGFSEWKGLRWVDHMDLGSYSWVLPVSQPSAFRGARRMEQPLPGFDSNQSDVLSFCAFPPKNALKRGHFKHPGRQENVCFIRSRKGSVCLAPLSFGTRVCGGPSLLGTRCLFPGGSRALMSSSSLKGDAPYLRSSLRWICQREKGAGSGERAFLPKEPGPANNRVVKQYQ